MARGWRGETSISVTSTSPQNFVEESIKNCESNKEEIFHKGMRLGKQLEGMEEGTRWNVLADFWAEMLIYLAPSDNVKEHIECLAKGGEFITHLWALLTHAGILERGPRIVIPNNIENAEGQQPHQEQAQGLQPDQPHTEDAQNLVNHHEIEEEEEEEASSNLRARRRGNTQNVEGQKAHQDQAQGLQPDQPHTNDTQNPVNHHEIEEEEEEEADRGAHVRSWQRWLL
nr:uncharacterized protein LOC117842632 [Setaria viridis]